MVKHLNIRVHGKVQGVVFRWSAQKEAEKLGLTGFAKNEADGSVYIEAEGEEKVIEQFLKWCKNGPEMAVVSKLETEEAKVKNFSDFTISVDAVPE
jgi:acylphosphatase